MIKKDFIYRFLTYLIMISAILLPWFADAKYNQDLLVMVVYLKTVFELGLINTCLLPALSAFKIVFNASPKTDILTIFLLDKMKLIF